MVSLHSYCGCVCVLISAVSTDAMRKFAYKKSDRDELLKCGAHVL